LEYLSWVNGKPFDACCLCVFRARKSKWIVNLAQYQVTIGLCAVIPAEAGIQVLPAKAGIKSH